jgi:hypothetical protein
MYCFLLLYLHLGMRKSSGAPVQIWFNVDHVARMGEMRIMYRTDQIFSNRQILEKTGIIMGQYLGYL